MVDFTVPADLADVARRVRAFVADEVVPREGDAGPPDAEADWKVVTDLRSKARAAGLWTPHLPPEHGGLGLGTLGMALVSEELGWSPLAPLALNASAPDEGNMHTLLAFGTPDQQAKYLKPLAAGDIRSCFAMTEPDAGSDPTRLATTAVRDGDGFVLNGHKVFITGAAGAAFAIVVARTDPDAGPKAGASLIIVDAKTPGWNVVRRIPVMGTHAPGGHCEVTLTDVRVPATNVLGPLHEGFKVAQARLGGGRLAHAMRWLGAAQRALDLAATRALTRETFGDVLARRQAVQWMLAESATELHASRLMVLHAAWKIERGDEHRQEIAMVKDHVANVLNRVVDRAIQVHGALGYSDDTVLARFYRDARAARLYDGPDEVHRMVIARNLLRAAAEAGSTRAATGALL